MKFELNKEMQDAFSIISETSQNLFLTGRAGTGKTTFLHYLMKNCKHKNMIVAAPTGIAAINAGGITIHSMFRLPLGPFRPRISGGLTYPAQSSYKLNDERVSILQKLDVLVVDEISMVRADILDEVNDALCYYRNDCRPFGGVQLLMIGDLQQLVPVCKEDEWETVRDLYETEFFFSSLALKVSGFKTISLTKIYRQKDPIFTSFLNEIRLGSIGKSAQNILNKLYQPSFKPGKESNYITLCSHNAAVNKINSYRLNELEGKMFSSRAFSTGSFPKAGSPCEEIFYFKCGAQVMFTVNDSDGRYCNGSLGVIVDYKKDTASIDVEMPSGKIVTVGLHTWDSNDYRLDENGRVVSVSMGTITQFPLKLAWAVTIHKSQGLTFDHVIIDAEAAFAHGQVYVALSRCRTLNGIKLISPISDKQIIVDEEINNFYKTNGLS